MSGERIVVVDIGTTELIDAFDYLIGTILSFWRATADGRLSRHVAPPADMEELVITLTDDLWRSVGTALRAGSATAVIESSTDPIRLRAALDAANRLLAFFPYARDIGVLGDADLTAEATIERVLDAFSAALAERGY